MPARKSDQHKQLRGSDRPCRRPVARLEALRDVPEAPGYLSPRAAEEWQRIAPYAVVVGVTDADLRALALLAETLASERSLRETIEAEGHTIESGSGARKAHPALAALDRTRQIAQRMLGDFGLNPRGRIALPKPPMPAEDNPFSRFGRRPGFEDF